MIAGITYPLVQNDFAVALALATGAYWLGLQDGLLTDVDPADFLWAWTTNPNGNGQTFNLPRWCLRLEHQRRTPCRQCSFLQQQTRQAVGTDQRPWIAEHLRVALFHRQAG